MYCLEGLEIIFFFFSSRRRHTRWPRDWSSDVCSSDLERFAETLTAHDLDAFSALLHPEYVNHNRYAEPGKAGSVAVFGAFFDAFDEFRAEVDDILAVEGTVVGRYTYRGRHTGTFFGVPASGAEMEMHTIDIWRVR